MFRRKPYIKKIDKIGKIKVWRVDGKYLRDKIDEEFTNFGQHYRFSFIPLNEFWIDQENSPGEEKFFIDHMLVEHRLMAEGKNFAEAIDKASRIELAEREKSKLVNKIIKQINNQDDLVSKVHKQMLDEYSYGKIKIWIVNGELVRDFFYIDFTEGGHNKVFPFIPENEVWIDDDVNVKERKYVILHELFERNHMPFGRQSKIKNKNLVLNKNYTQVYTVAHQKAAKAEYLCRHHAKKIDKKIEQELKQVNKK